MNDRTQAGEQSQQGSASPSTPQPEESLQNDPPCYNPMDGFQADDRFEHAQDRQEPLPSLKPLPAPPEQQPFYRRNPVTLAFALLLVAFYGLTSFPNGFESPTRLALGLGAFYGPAVQDGQWWRFITATLMHGYPGHLFNNVVGILIFGNLLEPVIGHFRLIGLYWVAAVSGLALVYWLQPNVPTLGASTIDYGLIGAYLTLILLLRYQYDRSAFIREFRGAILFVLMFVAWNWLESATVSLWGHVGGLLGGTAYGLLIWMNRAKAKQSTVG